VKKKILKDVKTGVSLISLNVKLDTLIELPTNVFLNVPNTSSTWLHTVKNPYSQIIVEKTIEYLSLLVPYV